MKSDTPIYHGYRFPPEIISHAVWLYHRFCVSFRDVEDLLAQRGITVSYEAIRLWCIQFGSEYARRLKRRQGRLGDTWHLDEVFVTIQGQRHDLWRAVDQDGDVIDILVQSRRDRRAAKRFIRKLLKGQGSEPGWLVTDKLRSYRAAHREVMPSVVYSTERYGNNRAEVSHQPTIWHYVALRGTTRHYVAQECPLHLVGGGVSPLLIACSRFSREPDCMLRVLDCVVVPSPMTTENVTNRTVKAPPKTGQNAAPGGISRPQLALRGTSLEH